MANILIVEDEAIIRKSLKLLLEGAQHSVTEAWSVATAAHHDLTQFDLVISDLRLPGGSGHALINLSAPTPVLILTSYASINAAVDAIKHGAVDFMPKPFDHGELLGKVDQILSNPAARQLPADTSGHGIIGESDGMRQLFNKIKRVGQADVTVLIHGESGTGKELVAKAIHMQSQRADEAQVSVNCAAIPETLIESELFGHQKGAFTGAHADRKGLIETASGGTLFLDEIGELPLESQARLLRVLQEGEIRRVGDVQPRKVDIRLVCATHRNLRKMVEQGQFREDLYYRLNVVELTVPALRERGDDIFLLAGAFLQRVSKKFDRPQLRLSNASRQALAAHSWPGNVRELENALERAGILAESDLVMPEHLGLENITQAPALPSEPLSQTEAETETETETETADEPRGEMSLEDYFQHFVLAHQDDMNETELAKRLGVSRKCLWERRQKLGIPRNPKRSTG